MAIATTQAVWRSGGGDQTRTTYCGSMVMAAQFYIANTAATSNVVISSATNAPALVLPAGAVVTEVIISGGAGGNATANIGFTPLVGVGPGQEGTLGTNVPAAFVSAGNVAARAVFTVANGGTSLGNVANVTNLIVVTSAQGATGAAAGSVTGDIIYYVADDGQQNV